MIIAIFALEKNVLTKTDSAKLDSPNKKKNIKIISKLLFAKTPAAQSIVFAKPIAA